MPAGLADVRALARSHSTMAIERLAYLAQHGKSEQACIAAAATLLDRAYGRPVQPVAGDAELPPIGISSTAVATLSADERAALVASIAESLRAAS
jgi:hypothetical protein